MKQGDRYIRFILILLAAAVLSYFGYAAYRYFQAPVATMTALEYEADVSSTATGHVVRQEQLLTAAQQITVPTRAEGEHVGSGQTVAVSYMTQQDQQQQEEIQNLQQQISMLNYAVDDSVAITALDSTLSGLLTQYAMRTALGQVSAGSTLGAEIKGLCIRSGTDASSRQALRQECSTLQKQLAAHTSQEGSQGTVQTAQTAGYFSGSADGYERILTPDRLQELTLSDLNALSGAAETLPQGTYGKLITSDTWYFVTAVPEESLPQDLQEGDTVQLCFTRDTYADIPMTLERIAPPEEGMRLLVLSCDRFLQDVTLLREQSCVLKYASYSGLRVPRSALHVSDDGQAGVYVLQGATAAWKPVRILYALTDNYVVALDQSSTDNLWPGDEILLGSDLYDGKVIQK